MTTVLVDLDGVLADWTAQFDADRAEHYPHIQFETLKEFTTPDHLPQHHREAIDWVKFRPGFYRDMKPIAGAVDGYRALVDAGHDVFICSTPETRNPTCASDKLEWVTKYLGADAALKTILTHDKTLVRGDLLIDDRPDVKGAMTPTWKQVLYTQPYNEDVDTYAVNNYFRRALGWADVQAVVEEFLATKLAKFATGGYVDRPATSPLISDGHGSVTYPATPPPVGRGQLFDINKRVGW